MESNLGDRINGSEIANALTDTQIKRYSASDPCGRRNRSGLGGGPRKGIYAC